MITTAELTDLLKCDLAKLTPVGADMTRRAIDQIEVRGIQASPQSLNTRSLMSALASVPELLAPGVEERIARHAIFGVESDYIGAVVRLRPSGAGQIFVFEGFLAFLHHFASSITVLNAFLSHDPGDPIEWRGQTISEAEGVCVALFALLARFLRTGERPPAIDHALDETERANVRLGLAAAVTFAVLHELAHIELGHFEGDRARGEIGHIALLEAEALTLFQLQEFEADEAALRMIAPAFRSDIQSSLLFLFGGNAFLEAFTGVSESHPLAINRLSRLADAAALPPDVQTIVASWIADRARHFRLMAGDRSGVEDGLARIEEKVPAREALAILSRANARLRKARNL